MNQSKMTEQELDDEDRQARFLRRRPDGFTVNVRRGSGVPSTDGPGTCIYSGDCIISELGPQ
jgi:hypothetical protein